MKELQAYGPLVAGGEPERPPWIDLHPHLFNAADLPIAEFIAKAGAPVRGVPGWALGQILAHLAESAPSAETDTAAIEDLMDSVEVEAAVDLPPLPKYDWPWRKASRYLDLIGEARLSRLVMLHRLNDMTLSNRDKYRQPIDLYTPLGVDLETGVNGTARSSPHQQFDLMELLSEATLRGHPESVHGTVLPVVGFDPMRTDMARNSLEEVIERVRSGRAIGVKLYPPMGFRPIGNSRDVDDQLHLLYDWCAREDVPVIAHCSPANAVRGAKDCARPEGWRPVLRSYEGLRINLAHVGGIDHHGWLAAAIELIDEHVPKGGRVFADVGNHNHHRNQVKDFITHIAEATAGASDPGGVMRQIAFGTDYWFLYMHPDPTGFLHRYVDEVEERFGRAALPRFAGGAAQEFLGLTDPLRPNRQRVIKRLMRLQAGPRGGFAVRESLRRALALTPQEIASIEAAGL